MFRKGSAFLFLIAGLATLLVLGGCGGGPSTVVRSDFVEFTPEQKAEIDAKAGDEYRIQEGDIIKVAFAYQKELNQENVLVLNDGSVGLIGVDRLELAGLTMTEADSLVTQAYARDYRDPDLSIIMTESQGRQVYVLGEVIRPGLHAVPPGGLDIIGAITVAGGFSQHAAKSGTILVRVTDEGYLVQEIDLDGFASVSYAALGVVSLQAYDVVYVPRSRIGDFDYFSRTVLAGLVNITRLAVDVKYLGQGGFGRF